MPPKKDPGVGKELKEKAAAEKSSKRDSGAFAKEGKSRDRDSMEKGAKKEPTTSRDPKDGIFAERGNGKEAATYELNSRVLCKYRDNLYYEAKVIAIEIVSEEGRMFTVHYQGWNARHDEKIPQADIKARFLPCTEENVEMAKKEMDEARQSQTKRKSRRFPGIGEEKKPGGTDSRSSTPSDKMPSGPASVASTERALIVGRKNKAGIARAAPERSEAGPPKKEIKIEMPASLKEILVDDYDMVTRQLHLARTPARCSVQTIVKQYADYLEGLLSHNKEITVVRENYEIWMRKDSLIACARGVQDFFDATLGARLLYKFEYAQYDELLERKVKELRDELLPAPPVEENSAIPDDLTLEKKWRSSDSYGFIHLLRLLVKFGILLDEAKWEEQGERSVLSIVEHVGKFVGFLEENRHKFFDIQKDYIIAPADYQKRFSDTQGS